MDRPPNLADWRAVVPDVNPEELELLHKLGMTEPHEVFAASEVLEVLREGIRIGRTIEAGQ